VEIEIQEFLDASGRSPFARWFEDLDAGAAARVTIALTRLSQGTSRLSKALAPVFTSSRYISGQDIGFTSAKMASGS
jgi:hypothetical protein